ncbi:PAS domain S-box protein, partial [bacterium]|nr:PAS domain S-box protein [bacterium]
ITAALRDSKENLRITLRSIGDAVIATDRDGLVTWMNPVAESLTGYSAEDALKKPIAEVFHIVNARTGEPAENPVANVIERGKVVGLANHTRLLSKSGSEYQISDSAAPIRAEDGEIRGVVLVFRDVTDEYAIREQLKISETKFRSLFDQSREGILLIRDTIIDCNQSAAAILGYSKTDLIGKRPSDFSPDQQADGVSSETLQIEIWSKAYAGEPHRFLWHCTRSDGEMSVIDVHLSRVEIGSQVALLATGRDVTEERRVQEALHISEEKYRLLVENSLHGTVIAQADPVRLVFASRYMESLSGYTCDELTSMGPDRIVELIHAEDRERFFTNFRERLSGEEVPAKTEYRIVRKDGEVRTVDIFSSRFEYDGKPASQTVFVDVTERKQAEEALRENEEKYRTLFETAHDAIFLMKGGKFLACNQSAVKMFGLNTAEDIVGQYPWMISPELQPDGRDSESAARDVVEAAQNGIPQEFYWLHKASDGTLFDADVSLNQLELDGEVYLQAIVRDISEQKRAERELQESRKFLQLVMDNIPQFIFWKDRESRYLGCNANFARAAGVRSPEDIIGKTDHDLAWKREEADFFIEVDKRVMEKNQTEFHIIEPQFQADGKQAWLDTNKIPLHDEGGNVIGILGTYEDITERKMAEEALKESEALFRSVIEQSNDAIYILYNRRFDLVNRRFCELTGMTVEEVRSPEFDFLSLVTPDDRDLIEERLRQRETGETLSDMYEFTLLPSHGEPRLVQTSVTVINYRDDTAILGHLRDITEQRSLEEQLRQAQKIESIGRLAGGIAHDFNNLLTPIIGNSELSMLELDPEEDLYQDMREIRDTAERASELTRKLLAFSRKQVLDLKTVELPGLVKNFREVLVRTIRENIQLEFHLGGGSVPVRVDVSQVEQILLNLVVNAQDAMPEGGTISISTDMSELDTGYAALHPEVHPGWYAVLDVSDTGIGMDEATRQRAFDPFFTTKETGKGTGLGLSTVHGIVKQHDGHVRAYSELGKGSTFRVYLPVVETETVSPLIRHAKDEVLHGQGTILVVEDQPQVREIASRILKQYGYTVRTAEHGEEALSLARRVSVKFDLLVTDIIMPGMNGQELYHQLLEIFPELKVLYMSGYSQNVISHHGILDEGIDFLQKPLRVEALAGKVMEILARKGRA